MAAGHDKGAELILGQMEWLEQRQKQLTLKQRKIVAGSIRELGAQLKRAKHGSWDQASAEATLAQVTDMVNKMRGRQTVDLRRALRGISQRSWKDAATFVTELDKAFTGSARPLAWDSVDYWAGAWGPYDKTRLRVYRRSFRRYGAAAVADIEVAIGQAVLLGQPWTEARAAVMKATKHVVGDKQWMVDRILRTETAAAYNSTTLQALHEENEPDDPIEKKLVATFDAVTARDSYALHGQTRPLGEKFLDPIRGREFMSPPNRPNDREHLVGWRKDWGDGRDFDDAMREASGVPVPPRVEPTPTPTPTPAAEPAPPKPEPKPAPEPERMAPRAAKHHASRRALQATLDGIDAKAGGPGAPLRSRKAVKAALNSRGKRGPEISEPGMRFRDTKGRKISPSGKLPDGRAKGWDTVLEAELRQLDRTKWGPNVSELNTRNVGLSENASMEISMYEHGSRYELNLNVDNMHYSAPQRAESVSSLADNRIPWSASARIPASEVARLREKYKRLKMDDDTLMSLVHVTRHEYGHGVEFMLRDLARVDPAAERVLREWNAARDKVSDATWGAGARTPPPGFKTPANSDAAGTWYQISEYSTTDEMEMTAEAFALASFGAWDSIPDPLHAPLRKMLELVN